MLRSSESSFSLSLSLTLFPSLFCIYCTVGGYDSRGIVSKSCSPHGPGPLKYAAATSNNAYPRRFKGSPCTP